MPLTETSLFGIRLCAGTQDLAAASIVDTAQAGSAALVCVANVDMVTRAVNDARLAQIMQHAFAVVTDGMPLVWALRRKGLAAAQRVYGPRLMRELCARAEDSGLPVYFFGGSPVELAKMQQNLLQSHPRLKIAGAMSPPMLPAEPPLDLSVAGAIQASGARLVFVGLGCPKQEYWMATHSPQLSATLIGVGLAFAQIAGLKKQAPAWMQSSGLEWLFRLVQEPRRLWRRYLVGNSRFLLYLARDAIRR